MEPEPKTNEQTATPASTSPSEITSIRTRMFERVLPVALVPLVLLGVFTIGAIFILQLSTARAVQSAEVILEENVVEDGVTRSSDRAARELAEYADGWISRTSETAADGQFLAVVQQTATQLRNLTFDRRDNDALQARLNGPITQDARDLALRLQDELRTFEEREDVQVLIVSDEGLNMGSSDPASALDHSSSLWFREARAIGFAVDPFVNDGDGPPAMEFAFRTPQPVGNSTGSVIRIRSSITNVQWILGEIAIDDLVTVTLVDNEGSVLLADTGSDNSSSLMFDEEMFDDPSSSLNPELLDEGNLRNETIVTAAREVSSRMENAFDIEIDWLVQTNQSLEIAGRSLNDIRQVSEDVSRLRQWVVIGVIAFLLGAGVITFLAIRKLSNQITEPVQQLSMQAQRAAGKGIPAIVEAARTSVDLPDLPQFKVESNDEIAILARSMNTMQNAAVDLAAGQAKLRRQNVARTFVSLGRRNQNLLNRQLEFIDELERQESDADALENLFRLDHLATRMRRNAENLLVLAGEQTPRRWAKPIAVRDVLRAAAAEIADYRRVRLGDIAPATVSGNLATDLSHLIAEILENAGSFSPPNTQIEVLGQLTETHYRLAVVDQGIGMDPDALAQVNDRLQNPVDFADAPSAYLGLFVVGRLAQELGIAVRLASADPTGEGRHRGTLAFIDIPVTLLSSAEPTPVSIDKAGSSEAEANRAEAIEAAQAQDYLPAPAPEPTAPVHTPLPTPTAISTTDGTTSAGFPKRSRGATSISDTPEIMTPSQPAVAPEAEQPVAPASETATPADVPATEITSAGFPKRSSSGEANQGVSPAAMPVAQAGAAPKRDAAEVSNSLRSIRAAVARGRAAGAEAPDEPAATQETPLLSPPPVPIVQGGSVQAPAAPTPVEPSPPTTVPNLPTQPGSES